MNEFQLLVSHDESPEASIFEQARSQLRLGDAIAYRMDRRQLRRDLLKGQLQKISYGVLRYGHLAMVVADPVKPDPLRIFSSESLKGPNVDEDLSGLMRGARTDRGDTHPSRGEYIGSSLVATAFYYAGIELGAIRQRAFDLLTPLQVVSGRGRIVKLHDVALELEDPDA